MNNSSLQSVWIPRDVFKSIIFYCRRRVWTERLLSTDLFLEDRVGQHPDLGVHRSLLHACLQVQRPEGQLFHYTPYKSTGTGVELPRDTKGFAFLSIQECRPAVVIPRHIHQED